MAKFKVRDRVSVYGTVSGGSLPKRDYAYYMSKGSPARVLSCCYGDDEMYVRFDEGDRAVSGHTATVHPMQCRKLTKKVKKNK